MLNKFLWGFFGYSYFQYLKSDTPSSFMCFVERVDVVLWTKRYTLVSVTNEMLAKAKVKRYNELYAPKWIKESV